MKTISWVLLSVLVLTTGTGALKAASKSRDPLVVTESNQPPKKVKKSKWDYRVKPYKFKKWKAPKAGKVRKPTR